MNGLDWSELSSGVDRAVVGLDPHVVVPGGGQISTVERGHI